MDDHDTLLIVNSESGRWRENITVTSSELCTFLLLSSISYLGELINT